MALDAGADPHAKTRSWSHDVDALYLSASSRQLAVFSLLLDRGADATMALTHALWNGGDDHAALAAAALAHGADVNRAEAAGRPLLSDLIRWGQFTPAQWLLAHGADPNRTQGMDGSPSAGWTALHQAASRGNAKMVEALLSAGADVGKRDAVGRTPRDIARAKAVLQWLTP
jgi:ankyrin repeat protein